MEKTKTISLKYVVEKFKALLEANKNTSKLVLDNIHDENLLIALGCIKKKRGALKITKYRTVYDVIANILSLNHRVLYVTLIVRKIGTPTKQLFPVIRFMEECGLIEPTYLPVIERPDRKIVGKRWKVTHKGELYLRRYRGLLHLLTPANSNNNTSDKHIE